MLNGLTCPKYYSFNTLPIIVGSPVVIECELIDFIETNNFSAVLARVVNIAADETVLGEDGKTVRNSIPSFFHADIAPVI